MDLESVVNDTNPEVLNKNDIDRIIFYLEYCKREEKNPKLEHTKL